MAKVQDIDLDKQLIKQAYDIASDKPLFDSKTNAEKTEIFRVLCVGIIDYLRILKKEE